MPIRTTFSIHAITRIDELGLVPAEVADLLDNDKGVPVGREHTKRRVHRLFYSAPDKACFIAIQDEVNGEVVTVRPIAHGRWVISMDAKQQAERLVAPKPVVKRPPERAIPSAAVVTPPSPQHLPRRRVIETSKLVRSYDNFTFYVVVQSGDGKNRRVKLGHASARVFNSVAEVLASSKAVARLTQGWYRHVTTDTHLIRCFVQKGPGSPCIDLDYLAR